MRWFRRRSRDPGLPPSATAQMRTALHLVLAGDLAAAEAALAEAAREDSSSTDVYLALANLYRARGDVGRAIQVHQNLLLRQDLPREVRREALMGLALDFRGAGFLRRAATSFEELLELEPNNRAALRELERIRVEAGEWEGAIQIRKRLRSRDRRSPSVLAHLLTGLGRAHAERGEEAAARKAFRRALGYDADCAEAHLALGDQCLREERPKKAIAHWRRTLGLHPAIGVVAYPRLWDAFVRLDDPAGFEALLREQLRADPGDADAMLWLARVLVRRKQVEEGLDALRELRKARPDYLPAHAEIARVLLAEGRQEEAVRDLESLLEHLPLERGKLQCQNCGTQDIRLHWRCPQCGEWDSFA